VKSKTSFRALLFPALILALTLLAAAALTFRIVRQNALYQIETLAKKETGLGSPVVGLLVLAGSQSVPLPRRNRAIWALGELRDPRALPHLTALANHNHCDHRRWVCQREVRLAISKINGELSFGGWLRTQLHTLGRPKHSAAAS
jgi:hypothetical protein